MSHETAYDAVLYSTNGFSLAKKNFKLSSICLLKHQFDALQRQASISWESESFLCYSQQSPGDGVSIKILVPIIIVAQPRDILKYQFGT